MESRAATVAPIACALAGVVAVLLKDFSSAEPHGLSVAATILAGIIVAAYIGAISLSLAALRPRTNWRAGPAPRRSTEPRAEAGRRYARTRLADMARKVVMVRGEAST